MTTISIVYNMDYINKTEKVFRKDESQMKIVKIEKAGSLPVFHRVKNEIPFDFGSNISDKKVKLFLPAGTEHHPHGWCDTTLGNDLNKEKRIRFKELTDAQGSHSVGFAP